MNRKFQKILTLTLLGSTAFLLTACTSNLPFSNKPEESTSNENGQATTNPDNDSPFGSKIKERVKTNLTNLMKTGENLKCTVNEQLETQNFVATTYIANGKVYIVSNLTESLPEKDNSETYIIFKDNILYTWGNSSKSSGLKVDLGNNSSIEKSKNSVIRILENANYNCKPWTEVDPQLFELPTDVSFLEISNSSSKQPILSPSKKQLCQSCERIEDETKKQKCLEAMDCE